jgi:hypothetical protein
LNVAAENYYKASKFDLALKELYNATVSLKEVLNGFLLGRDYEQICAPAYV